MMISSIEDVDGAGGNEFFGKMMASHSLNDEDSFLATLQEAMEIEDMEMRIVVSGMVREAITRGLLRGVEEESKEHLAANNAELCKFRDNLKDKELTIAKLEMALERKQQELSTQFEESTARIQRQVLDFLHEREQLQQKWQETEALVAVKEVELTKLAASMVEMTSFLDMESNKVVRLEKQVMELQELDSSKSREISSLHAEMDRIKENHRTSYARLKREARLNELKFNESLDHMLVEKEKQVAQIERVLEEKYGHIDNLENILREKDELIHSLKLDISQSALVVEELELKLANLTEEIVSLSNDTDHLLKAEHDNIFLKEQFEELRLLQETEREYVGVFLEGQISHMAGEVEENAVLHRLNSCLQGMVVDLEKAIHFHKDVLKEQSVIPLDRYEMFGKLTQDFFCFRRRVVEMKHVFLSPQENLGPVNKHKLEVELGSISHYWQQLLRVLHAQNKDLYRQLSESNALTNENLTYIEANKPQTKWQPAELEYYIKHGHEIRIENLLAELEGKVDYKGAEISKLNESLEELKWKNDVEGTLIFGLVEGWCREISELFPEHIQDSAWKQNENFDCKDGEPLNLKQIFMGKREEERELLGQLEQELAGKQLMYELELSTILDVLDHKYKELIEGILAFSCSSDGAESMVALPTRAITDLEEVLNIKTQEVESLREESKRTWKSLEVLEARFGLFTEVEICTLEKVVCGCSMLSAKCGDLNVVIDMVTQSLDRQFKEMEQKIFSLQAAIEHKEWCHKVEDDILILVLMDALGETQRRLEAEGVSKWIRNINTSILHGDNELATSSLVDKAVGCCLDTENKSQREADYTVLIENIDCPAGDLEKEKYITSLKRMIRELRRDNEQILESKTEEIYKLKREFWKENEKWSSRVSHPNNVIGGLSRRFSEGSEQLQNAFRDMGLTDKDVLASRWKEEWQTEKIGFLENLLSQKERDLQNVTEQLEQKGRSHAATEARLLEDVRVLETERAKLIERLKDDEASSSKLIHELQTENFGLLEKISEAEKDLKEAKGKFDEVVVKEKKHDIMEVRLLARIEELETEKNRLMAGRRNEESLARSLLEGKEIALAVAVKDKELEEKRRRILEMQVQNLKDDVKRLQGLNEDMVGLQSKLGSFEKQMELKFEEEIIRCVQASNEFQCRVMQKMEEKIVRLDKIKEKCDLLKGTLKGFVIRESHYKRKLNREVNNLQKAEAEVDLLGDEVDALLDLVEKVYAALDHYSPVLQHYPGMMKLTKLVKQEIQLRINPRYGV